MISNHYSPPGSRRDKITRHERKKISVRNLQYGSLIRLVGGIRMRPRTTVGTFLECKCRVMDAHGKFGEHERSMRVTGAKAESRSTVRIFCMYETCIERPCLNRCSLEFTARKLRTANILCVHCIFPSNEQYVCSYYMLNHRTNILLFHYWIMF